MTIKELISWIVLIVVVNLLIIGASSSKPKSASPTPNSTPSVAETPSAQKKYLDMLTNKCYNDQEVEVPCKG